MKDENLYVKAKTLTYIEQRTFHQSSLKQSKESNKNSPKYIKKPILAYLPTINSSTF